MSLVDLLLGRCAEVTGIAENDDGSLKVYVGPRYHGRYVVIDDPTAADEVRRAWADPTQHVLIPAPDADQIFADEASPRGRSEA